MADATTDRVRNAPSTSADGKTSIRMEKDLAEQEDEYVRLTNAYPGAENTIGSIHQRSWHLSLDKPSSGFVRRVDGRGVKSWVGGFEAFYVRGRDWERSVVTGRSADEVLADEGVEGFVMRKGWRAVME